MYCIEKKNTELAGKKMRNMSRASNCAYFLRIESRIHLVHRAKCTEKDAIFVSNFVRQ